MYERRRLGQNQFPPGDDDVGDLPEGIGEARETESESSRIRSISHVWSFTISKSWFETSRMVRKDDDDKRQTLVRKIGGVRDP